MKCSHKTKLIVYYPQKSRASVVRKRNSTQEMVKQFNHSTVSWIVLASIPLVMGHGRLMRPPSRSSMWRLGYQTMPNYNDNELFCGGFEVQRANGMRCGVCGDPYTASPQDNAMGGKYYKGIITAKYTAGDIITALVELTANHNGFFEFKLCPANGNPAMETDACMQRYPLQVIGKGRRNGFPTRYYVPNPRAGIFHVRLKLPNISCRHCVFQWTYTAGTSWGICENGLQALGCGPQETFRGCADIAIRKGEQPNVPSWTPSANSVSPSYRPSVGPAVRPTARYTLRPNYAVIPSRGGKCTAINGQPEMDAWCNSNCFHQPSNCPASLCRCQ